MLKIMLCSVLHTRMTARIPLGDGCWSFQVWGCATLSRASKTYCIFWLVLFQGFGFGNICHDGSENVTWKIYNGAGWFERFLFSRLRSSLGNIGHRVKLSGGDVWNKHAPAGHIEAGASWQEPNEGDHPDRWDKEGSQLKPSGNRCLIVLVGVPGGLLD